MISLTPLEAWIANRISGPGEPSSLTQAGLRRYQLDKLQGLIEYVRVHSPFYRRHLAGLSGKAIRNRNDLASLPFTTQRDLQTESLQFLCVSQSSIERVVTLPGFAPAATPRRLFFTREDLEQTIDFFHHGMSTLVGPDDRVLILMPGEKPDSVGDLLHRGLRRLGVSSLVQGPVVDPVQTAEVILKNRMNCLVGIPTQVLALARCLPGENRLRGLISTVLLSSDYVSRALVTVLEKTWGCTVFSHYGLAETGYGGGVECQARQGYHLREADLYLEIIDPLTRQPLPDGESGEIVVTTLTRAGMPLIRYRTGDVSRFIPGLCPCGSVLKRLDKVSHSLDRVVPLGPGIFLTMSQLDEALFPQPGLIDFQADVTRADDRDSLDIVLQLTEGTDPGRLADWIHERLTAVPGIYEAVGDGNLVIGNVVSGTGYQPATGSKKRLINDHRPLRSE
jgi:phenylacetate-coenzyme A ligase PaaK-like adenylate-forming protein